MSDSDEQNHTVSGLYETILSGETHIKYSNK